MNPSLCIVVEIIIWAIQGNLYTEGFKAEVLGTSLLFWWKEMSGNSGPLGVQHLLQRLIAWEFLVSGLRYWPRFPLQ